MDCLCQSDLKYQKREIFGRLNEESSNDKDVFSKRKSLRRDLNSGPPHYQCDAIPLSHGGVLLVKNCLFKCVSF